MPESATQTDSMDNISIEASTAVFTLVTSECRNIKKGSRRFAGFLYQNSSNGVIQSSAEKGMVR
jgi:hypothetical protein